MAHCADLKLDFMRFRKIALAGSVIALLISVISLATKQLSFGLDFTGGSLVELEFAKPVELNAVRDLLRGAGIEDAVVQHFGRSTEVVIRVPADKTASSFGGNDPDAQHQLEHAEVSIGQRIYEVIKAQFNEVIFKRNEFIGPQIGSELRDQGGIAMLIALGCMLLYVGFRFRFKFAIGAVVALFHDVIIVLGFFSLFSLPFDQSVLAAILAVIGYSLNDTIVVSDRIRENFKGEQDQQGDEQPIGLINASLNQTLSRTLITSLTTLLVLLALLALGGEAIRYFAVALIVGVVVGTYSSIYVAANILIFMHLSKDDFIEVSPETADDLP